MMHYDRLLIFRCLFSILTPKLPPRLFIVQSIELFRALTLLFYGVLVIVSSFPFLQHPSKAQAHPGTSRRRWILIGAVAVIICAIVIVTAVLYSETGHDHTPSPTPPPAPGARYTFDDIFNPAFSPKSTRLSWIAADAFLVEKSGALYRFDVQSQNSTLLFNLTGYDSWQLSPTSSYLLLSFNTTAVGDDETTETRIS
jgi:hypothetical protein